MLSYEPGAIQRFPFGKTRLRLLLLRYVQNQSLRASSGVVFLTRYAGNVIQRSCGAIERVAFIPHGVGAAFKTIIRARSWPAESDVIRCLYVSNAALYKHQWQVIRAFARLRAQGLKVKLVLTGGGAGSGAGGAQRLIDSAIAEADPDGTFVETIGAVPPMDLPGLLADADVFVFASSCENMPNTLLEAMAAGLPIACSNRGPMPEVLSDGGLYFDPESPMEIAIAIERIVKDSAVRKMIAARAKHLSDQYSWSRCADETFAFLVGTYRSFAGDNGAASDSTRISTMNSCFSEWRQR